jgi:hypothetical protein
MSESTQTLQTVTEKLKQITAEFAKISSWVDFSMDRLADAFLLEWQE